MSGAKQAGGRILSGRHLRYDKRGAAAGPAPGAELWKGGSRLLGEPESLLCRVVGTWCGDQASVALAGRWLDTQALSPEKGSEGGCCASNRVPDMGADSPQPLGVSEVVNIGQLCSQGFRVDEAAGWRLQRRASRGRTPSNQHRLSGGASWHLDPVCDE